MRARAVPNDRAKVLLAAVLEGRAPAAEPDHHRRPHQRDARRRQAGRRLGACRPPAPTRPAPLLQSNGVDPDRIYQVAGKAASDPLYPDDPLLPGNRRITITLLREAPVLPSDAGP